MFGGDEVTATLEWRNNLMKIIIDKLGDDVNLIKLDEQSDLIFVKI